jgi:hypothetical protein
VWPSTILKLWLHHCNSKVSLEKRGRAASIGMWDISMKPSRGYYFGEDLPCACMLDTEMNVHWLDHVELHHAELILLSILFFMLTIYNVLKGLCSHMTCLFHTFALKVIHTIVLTPFHVLKRNVTPKYIC